LRRVVELAGMSAYCDYSEQVTLSGSDEDGARNLRPDMIVTLPAGRKIIVDSKAPLDAYLSAVSAQTEEEKQNFLRQHARHIKEHVRRLSSKQYWSQLDETPEFVVLFIPGESFFSAALEIERTLLEDAWTQRIAITTPTTLVALLRMVAFGWREESLARSARDISDLGKDLYERLGVFCRHLADVGGRLESATKSYNSAVSSLERRVLPCARRFESLKVAEPAADYDRIAPLETMPRELTGPEAADYLNAKTAENS
jgi:DNA recombination protein RmuC